MPIPDESSYIWPLATRFLKHRGAWTAELVSTIWDGDHLPTYFLKYKKKKSSGLPLLISVYFPPVIFQTVSEKLLPLQGYYMLGKTNGLPDTVGSSQTYIKSFHLTHPNKCQFIQQSNAKRFPDLVPFKFLPASFWHSIMHHHQLRLYKQ